MSALFGEVIDVRQDNGPDVSLVVTGDEFYVEYETLDGYAAVYDEQKGLYCYAELSEGSFSSSGLPVTKSAPVGTPKHLRESDAVRAARFDSRFARLRGDDQPERLLSEMASRTLGRANGLLRGRRVSSGTVQGLTVIVEFQDVRAAVDPDDVNNMLNGANFSLNGNFCSVREYFRLMSTDRLDYQNVVVGPVRLSRNRSYYETTSLVDEALDIAVDQFNLDLSEFVTQEDRVVDAINFMYAGRTVYHVAGTNTPSELWPHNFVTRRTFDTPSGPVSTYFYQLCSLGRHRVDLSIGTFSHENGHMLCRFPDIYDYGRRDDDFVKSLGIGPYCLMGSGNHNGSGRTPSPICSYLRDLVGWSGNEVILNGGQDVAARYDDYDTVYKYLTTKANEYFMIENRSALGLDQNQAASGLAIFHCDTKGSNEWQQGTPTRHYQCALLQADGRNDLEKNVRGFLAGDLYGETPGIAASATTNPSTKAWDQTDSGLKVSDISAPGEEVSFRVGDPPVPPIGGTDSVTVSSDLDLLIPDNRPEGVSTSLTLAPNGDVTSIDVEVDILHTWIGDLELSLEAPSGETIVLRERSGGSADDIFDRYSSDTHEQLGNLTGESVHGDWTLKIVDHARRDVGRLDRWSLTIGYEQGDKTLERSRNPNAAIPDRSSGGVKDSLNIAQKGTLREVSVKVDITHTWIGDLIVELRSPSGESIALHDRSGRSRDDIHRVYDVSTTPALESLIGSQIKGRWSLAVKDLAAQDVGTLDEWALTLVYSPGS